MIFLARKAFRAKIRARIRPKEDYPASALEQLLNQYKKQ